MDDVNIWIVPPPVFIPRHRNAMKKQLQPGEKLPDLEVVIKIDRISVGIKGNPPFMSEELGGKVCTDESYWMVEDDELHI